MIGTGTCPYLIMEIPCIFPTIYTLVVREKKEQNYCMYIKEKQIHIHIYTTNLAEKSDY